MDLLYLIRSGLRIPDYWHPYLEIQSDFLSRKIGRYPISMDVKADYPGQLNSDEVPILFENGTASESPIAIALYGLGSHDVFLRTDNQRYRRQFVNALQWLENHPVQLRQGIGWPYETDLPVYGLKAPWFSAIVQGSALSLFVRAHQLEGSSRWSKMAIQTWLGYHAPVEEGGFCRKIPAGVIYEEYPGPELDCVFNGMCVSLIGLWEAWQSGIVREAEADFQMGLLGLRSLLPRFAYGRWSLYSLNRCLGKALLASPYYHRANALLAEVIGLMSGDAEFHAYGKRWLNSTESVVRRLAMSLRIGFDRATGAPALLHSDKSKLAHFDLLYRDR